MSNALPPLRTLPATRHVARRSQLLEAIADARPARRSARQVVPRAVAALAVLALLAAAAAISERGHSQRYVAVENHGPAWSAVGPAVNWGGGISPSCGGKRGCSGDELVHPDPVRPTRIVGGTAAQHSLLEQIVAATTPNAIDVIAIEATPGRVTLKVTAPTSLQTLWQGSLIAAAFRDRLAQSGRPVDVSIAAGTDNGPLPPGPATARGNAAPGSAAAVGRRVTASAARAGATVAALDVYRPAGVAFSVTLRVAHGPVFLRHKLPIFLAAVGNRWTDYDGTDIRVIDLDGKLLYESTTNARTSTGAVLARADVAGCVSQSHWTARPCTR